MRNGSAPVARAASTSCPTAPSSSCDDEPWLVLGAELLRWTPGGYTERRARPRGNATIVTPQSSLEALRAGWSGVVPFLHPSTTEVERP